MMTPFEGKHILLGVTGSIAAYKSADLASKLSQAGAEVNAILTQAATRFITPLTFRSVTGRDAYIDADLWGNEGHVLHIGLARQADLLVIAPASANTLAKLANGLADNLLTVTALAADCPLLLAPAMDGGMFSHPATQSNLKSLRQRGAILSGPVQGHLASGLTGTGRMLEPSELLGQIRLALSRGGPLQDCTVLVTAGGTQEPLDPVRVITNRSSGKQGFAMAQAALDLGAQVILISAPLSLPAPTGAQRVDVNTTQEMLEAVLDFIPQTDVLVMVAAVADFQPVNPAAQKIKRRNGVPEVKLEAAPDILGVLAARQPAQERPRITIGFAAESQNLLDNARAKLTSKHLDLIVANDISHPDSGFSVDTNRVTLLFADGRVESLPLMSKEQVAQNVMERLIALLQGKAP